MATVRHILLNAHDAEYWEAEDVEGNGIVLWNGEFGYDTTNRRIKVGDGVTKWNDLPYVAPDVENVLTSTSKRTALSAAQGRVLYREIPLSVDNLTTTALRVTDSGSEDYGRPYALSARQGKELYTLTPKTVDNHTTSDLYDKDSASKDYRRYYALSARQGNVLFKALPIVKNNLTTTDLKVTNSESTDYGRPYALSAYQGYVLKGLVDGKASQSDLTTLQNTVNTHTTKITVLETTQNNLTSEEWTFTLSSGGTVTKKVALWSS